MKYTLELLLRKYVNATFENSPLRFFIERTATFLSTLMPVSSLFLFRASGNVTIKLAECNKTPGVHVSDRVVIPAETMTRLRTEKHFFSGSLCEAKIFTGLETCVYAEMHRALYKIDTSAIYIPIKYNLLKETRVILVVASAGVDNYTQEHLDICTTLQPVFIDCFLNILSEHSPQTDAGAKEGDSANMLSSEAFETFDEVTVGHILKALNRTGGKISGQDGAASLLGLNPSTLWSKIRKYHIDVKGLERE